MMEDIQVLTVPGLSGAVKAFRYGLGVLAGNFRNAWMTGIPPALHVAAHTPDRAHHVRR
jgi:hypothetical protein